LRNPEARVAILDPLRGIATLSVAWFHFTNNNPVLPQGSLLRASGSYAWLGVEMFFVISGFVIPWALYQGRYRLRDFGRFMLRRMIRLDPSYLVAILITIALGYLSAASPAYKGAPYEVTIPQVLAHVAFLNVVTGHPWINEVFWTLAVEFQFYLMLGLIFPFLVSGRKTLRYGALVLLGLCGLTLNPEGSLFPYLFVFLAGILTCQLKLDFIPLPAYALGLVLCIGGNLATIGGPHAIVATATALLIAFSSAWSSRFLAFFGAISYPLYLLHGPIGGRTVNFLGRMEWIRDNPVASIAAAFATSIFAAFLLHLFVEVPTRRLASSIRYPASPVAHAEAASL
jgi:peptidoglycan/LPS O-acetylase OafA/YrhL